MPTKKRTISVRLDEDEARRLEQAARLRRQSRGAFLEQAGDEAARRVLLDWAAARYREGRATFSELAARTGLGVEEIMTALGGADPDAGLQMFLASCRTVADTQQHPEFLQLGEEAVRLVRAELARGGFDLDYGSSSASGGQSKSPDPV